ncbi:MULTISPECIES: GNAT family N-acetyltransferase [unclassified Leifsonia]|uniref:GNAT family N-acetyltransferase n=1 Tax=unclassified Leifsonia TaxID=2663824 RepID=UPI000A197A5E|nr:MULTISPECIES: GNAT family N-acetyltransferase [unclassified Leifsonia]QIZ97329.1 N-acetyltransferase [Leifsonia sp. PS1209]
MSLTVVKQPESSRYVLVKDGEQIGVAEYDLRDDAIVFTHTVIDEEKREKGMASTLVQEALDDVRANTDLRVVATCPYVRHWLREHPEYQDLQSR